MPPNIVEKNMNKVLDLVALHSAFGLLLDHLRPVLLLATRLWVSWQFLKSGWLKITHWDTTLELFRSEYHVPLMPPAFAAVAGTFGELFFPLLLITGLFTRLGALGLFAVNSMAVVSYWHVIGGEGFEAALAQHVLWGYMLAVVATVGAGGISLDAFLERRSAARSRMTVGGMDAA
jgi:putative oxidoreductase